MKPASAAHVRSIRQREFLTALRQHSGKPLSSFSRTVPPVNSIGYHDEDDVLARVFAEIAAGWPYHTPRHALEVLTSEIAYHERQFQRLIDATRGPKTGPNSRDVWTGTKPYKELLDVLSAWADSIYDILSAEAWRQTASFEQTSITPKELAQ